MSLIPVLLGVALGASAQTDATHRLGWRDVVSGQPNTPENVGGLGFDPAGSLIVAGTVTVSRGGGSNRDVLVKKLSPGGQTEWQVVFDPQRGTQNDSVQGLVVDRSGDAFVSIAAPVKNFDGFHLARVSNGRVAWSKTLDTDNVRATAFDLIQDAEGNLIQVGGFGSNAREQILTVKWSPSGQVLWSQTWKPQPAKESQGLAAAAAPNGDVIVGGMAFPDRGSEDGIVLRYSSSGQLLWSHDVRGEGFARDLVRAVAVGPDGDVYATGRLYVTGSASYLFVRRLNGSDGSVKWTYLLDNPRGIDGLGVGLLVDSQGVTVGGSGNVVSGARQDFVAIRLDNSGKEVWRRVIGSGPGNEDLVTKVAHDRYGNLYLAGSAAASNAAEDFFTVRVNPDGSVAWAHLDGEDSNSRLVPTALAVDHLSGDVAFGGPPTSSPADDWRVVSLFQYPTARDDAFSTLVDEPITRTPTTGVLSNDVFPRWATVRVLDAPGQGTLDLKPDGSFTYTPPKDFAGEVSFRYQAIRPDLRVTQGTVRITVRRPPPPPPSR